MTPFVSWVLVLGTGAWFVYGGLKLARRLVDNEDRMSDEWLQDHRADMGPHR